MVFEIGYVVGGDGLTKASKMSTIALAAQTIGFISFAITLATLLGQSLPLPASRLVPGN